MKDNTILYLGLGAFGLWLLSQMSPTAQAAQQTALANAAALQSQAITSNANVQNVNTAASALENIVGDFSS